jgi:hypothetical protein
MCRDYATGCDILDNPCAQLIAANTCPSGSRSLARRIQRAASRKQEKLLLVGQNLIVFSSYLRNAQ